jgi:cation diffusion facilitator family transporter
MNRDREQTRGAVIASIAANVAIAAVKFVVAAITRSTAMLAEAVHSLANCFDGSLLLFGEHRARRAADAVHPFGYGRELYFWSFVVAVVFFTLGAGFTVYEGVRHVLHPEPLGDPTWSYVVLGAAALFDGASFVVGFRAFRRHTRGRGFWRTVRESKNPSLFSVVLEDTADLLGLTLAFAGVYLSHALNEPALDGVASIAIGGVLGALAVVLLVETHGLLIGEAARPELIAAVRALVGSDDLVARAEPPLTVHTGPDEVVLVVRVVLRPELRAGEAATRIGVLERRLRTEHPELRRIFVAIAPES